MEVLRAMMMLMVVKVMVTVETVAVMLIPVQVMTADC